MSAALLKTGDRVVMASFHWVFEVVSLDDASVLLRTPYGALVSFPLDVVSRTDDPFEQRWGTYGPIDTKETNG